MSDDYANTFPPELWVYTFRFLPLKDLLHCSLVSRFVFSSLLLLFANLLITGNGTSYHKKKACGGDCL